jgi:hypothetical protein
MVIVQVGQHNIRYLSRTDTEQPHSLTWAAQELTASFLGNFAIKAGVDDDGARRSTDYENKVVKWHRPFMRVSAKEVLTPRPRLMLRKFDCIHFM